MAFTLPKPKSFKQAPEGTYLAICYRIIDLGTQTGEYKGKPKKSHQILVTWEIHGDEETKDDKGEPLMISKKYNFSSSEKSILRKDLESWRAKKFTDDEISQFDPRKLVGHPCFLVITHDERDNTTYANVNSVNAVVKGTPVPAMHNPKTSLVLTPEDFDKAVFEELADGLKEIIKKSPEYQAIVTGKPMEQAAADDFDDEIPF